MAGPAGPYPPYVGTAKPPAAGHGLPPRTGTAPAGVGRAALIFGILAVLCGLAVDWLFVGLWFGSVRSVLAIIVGVVALTFGLVAFVVGLVGRHDATHRGAALAGVMLGLLSVVIVVAWVAFFRPDRSEQYANCFERAAGDRAKQDRCVQNYTDSLDSPMPFPSTIRR